ncbi:PAS domain-containing protein [Aquimarina sp. 2201CG1-2-11]|uniref:PAS domain-containing sensor histidine kinase n=1 Tax=Aquimarina discodermiae TaxID=3231043 RepID=UPI0034629F62
MINKEKKVANTTLGKKENYLKKELYNLIKNDSAVFDFLQDVTIDGLWFWDLDKPENEWMNSKFWTTLGYEPEEMPHKSSAWQDIIFQEDLKNVYKNFAEHSKNPEHPFDQIVRYKHKLGHTIWIQCKGLIWRDSKGKPRRMLGAHTDLTKLKNAEESLRKRIDSFQHIIDVTDMGTWQWNIQTGEVVFNERWANIIGYTLDELKPISIDTWLKYAHPEDLKKSNELLQDHFSGKTSVYEIEARMKHKNGDYIWVLDKGKVVSRDAQGDPEWMIGSHQEINEKKKDYERNRLFIEQAPSAIAMFDVEMNYLAASQKWYEVYEINEENVIGKLYYDIRTRTKKLTNQIKEIHQKCLNGEVIRDHEKEIKSVNKATKWLLCEYRPWYSNENKIGGIIIHTSDITKIKKEKELQAILEVTKDQNRRLKNFAHIVSHNLKSHSGNFEMLLDLYIQENPEVEYNEIIQLFKKASQNLSETVLHLNDVVLINTTLSENLSSISLKRIIDKVIRTVSAFAIESKVVINNNVDENILVLAIQAYLDSIILNFITNSIKYRSPDRKSHVTLTTEKNKDYVVLKIEDNGLGIDLKKHRSKLFGMYKTFHPNVSNSRGIGLFIAKNQIEAIGGDIEVESEVNYGTTFKIYFRYEKS